MNFWLSLRTITPHLSYFILTSKKSLFILGNLVWSQRPRTRSASHQPIPWLGSLLFHSHGRFLSSAVSIVIGIGKEDLDPIFVCCLPSSTCAFWHFLCLGGVYTNRQSPGLVIHMPRGDPRHRACLHSAKISSLAQHLRTTLTLRRVFHKT